MDWFLVVIYSFLRRFRRSWILMILAAFAVLSSVTMVAATYIYSQVQGEGALRETLASTSDNSLHTRVIVRDRPLLPSDYNQLDEFVDSSITKRMGWLRDSQVRWGRTQDFDLTLIAGAAPQFGNPITFFTFRTGLDEHTELTAGRWPEVVPLQEPEPEIDPEASEGEPVLDLPPIDLEVAVASNVADSLNWGLGMRIYLVPFIDIPEEFVTMKIVGIIQPLNPDEIYWLGDLSDFRVGGARSRRVGPLFISEQALFERIGSVYPIFSGDFGWDVFLDLDKVPDRSTKTIRSQLTGLEADINKEYARSLVISGLDVLLKDYEREISLVRVPLFLFTSLVVGLVLYLLLISVNLLVQVRKEEAALLRSRGATTSQATLLLTFGEGVVVVILSIVIGPLIGYAINRFWLAGAIDPPHVEPGAISVSLSTQVYLLGAGIGLVGLLVFLLATLGLTRLSPADSLKERARPPTKPVVHRYYLDVLVVGFSALIWWQARERGGFVSSGLLGGLEVDSSLLISPALILLGAALVFLRLFPIILRILDRIVEPINVAWANFAIKRMARSPMLHGSLALMVMGATSLGILGATFEPTLSRSQEEQAIYKIGTEISAANPSATGKDMVPLLLSLPGTEAVSSLRRERVQMVVGKAAEPTISLLAVTPETLLATAWFRPDFADQEFSDLISTISEAQPPVTGVPIPLGAQRIGFWMRMEEFRSILSTRINVWARVVDSEGRYSNVGLGSLSSEQEWVLLEGKLPRSSGVLIYRDKFAEPALFHLVSIFMSGSAFLPTDTAIQIDDVTAWGEELPEEGVIFESFEPSDPDYGWLPVPTGGTQEDTVRIQDTAARSGVRGLRLSMGQTKAQSNRGIFIPSGPYPVPVITGPGFWVGQRLTLRNGRSLIPVQVAANLDYFPTFNPVKQSIVILNLDHYQAILKHLSPTTRVSPNEFWITPDPTIDREKYLTVLGEELPPFFAIKDSKGAVELALKDPLAAGAWEGLTIFSIVVLVAAVLFGLGLMGAVALRQGRLDFSVVRALGLSHWQLMASLAVERVLMIVLSIVAGGLVGWFLSTWVLDYLDITPTGTEILPPLALGIDTNLLIAAGVGLACAALIAIAFTMFMASRMKLARELREFE